MSVSVQSLAVVTQLDLSFVCFELILEKIALNDGLIALNLQTQHQTLSYLKKTINSGKRITTHTHLLVGRKLLRPAARENNQPEA